MPEDSRSANRAALLDALNGVDLRERDRLTLAWLSGWEPDTVATVCSWLHRVRALPVAETAPEVPDER